MSLSAELVLFVSHRRKPFYMLWFTDLLLPAGVVHAFLVSLLICLLFLIGGSIFLLIWGSMFWKKLPWFLGGFGRLGTLSFGTINSLLLPLPCLQLEKFLNHYQLAQKLGDPSVLFFSAEDVVERALDAT